MIVPWNLIYDLDILSDVYYIDYVDYSATYAWKLIKSPHVKYINKLKIELNSIPDAYEEAIEGQDLPNRGKIETKFGILQIDGYFSEFG